jgi:F-type H+-transporting ATPase subunit c
MQKLLPFLYRSAGLFILATSVALAEEGDGWKGVGAGLAMGLAALGGGMGQGRTASAGLEGMARNPAAAGSLNTPMIIGLVFTETLVLFSMVIALKLSGVF